MLKNSECEICEQIINGLRHKRILEFRQLVPNTCICRDDHKLLKVDDRTWWCKECGFALILSTDDIEHVTIISQEEPKFLMSLKEPTSEFNSTHKTNGDRSFKLDRKPNPQRPRVRNYPHCCLNCQHSWWSEKEKSRRCPKCHSTRYETITENENLL